MTQLSFEVTRRDEVTSPERIAEILENPGFGKTFTDHMVVATWTADGGWADAQVKPYGPFQLDPAAAVLHYAQEIFEGMKAYRHADGSIWTFRPEANAARFARSARRLALPELPEADFIESLRQLVSVDQAWVPAGDAGEKSLYLRPFMFASEAFLGVRPAQRVTYSVIASRPVPTSPADSSPSRCGSRPTTRVRARAAPAPPSAVATTPARSRASSRASSTAATRPSSSTPRRTPTSRSSGA